MNFDFSVLFKPPLPILPMNALFGLPANSLLPRFTGWVFSLGRPESSGFRRGIPAPVPRLY